MVDPGFIFWGPFIYLDLEPIYLFRNYFRLKIKQHGLKEFDSEIENLVSDETEFDKRN